MEEWLHNLFTWLPDGVPYYLLLGTISLLESVAGIGLLVPGTVLVVFAGFLAFSGKGEFFPLFAAAATGALTGDLVSFWLGARLGVSVVQQRLLRRQTELLRRAELFFVAHGGKSVFFGRFVGPLRGLIPFVAGCTRMSFISFGLYSLLSALLWGLAYPGLGYLGGASWRQVRLWSSRFGLLMILLLLLVILNALFWKRWAPPLAARLGRLWRRLGSSWEAAVQRPPLLTFRHRHPRLWQFLADRFTLHRGSGLYLTTGFAVSALFAALFLWLTGDIPLLTRLDRQVYSLLLAFRHPAADALMTGIALLADGPTLLLLTAYVLLWLILHNRDFSALILLVGLGGGDLLLRLLHLFFRRPAPPLFYPEMPVFLTGFPSDHAFTVHLFSGLVIYFILGTFRQWQSRITLIVAGSSLPLLVGFSHLYLGLQWLTPLLAGFALSSLWLTFLITAAEMRRRYAGEFPWRVGWEPLRLTAVQRGIILTGAGLAVAGGIIYRLIRQLGLA